MIRQYLEYHFEPMIGDNFQMETEETRRSDDAYPDFQSVILTHRLLDGGFLVPLLPIMLSRGHS